MSEWYFLKLQNCDKPLLCPCIDAVMSSKKISTQIKISPNFWSSHYLFIVRQTGKQPAISSLLFIYKPVSNNNEIHLCEWFNLQKCNLAKTIQRIQTVHQMHIQCAEKKKKNHVSLSPNLWKHILNICIHSAWDSTLKAYAFAVLHAGTCTDLIGTGDFGTGFFHEHLFQLVDIERTTD